MRAIYLAILMFFTCVLPILAVDLSITDAVVDNLGITLNASLSASSNYYLQATIRSQSSSKYFGETQNNKGDYIDYVSSPEKEYVVSNFFVTDIKNASWSGMVKLRFKSDDQSYLGPGQYDLKLRRFTGNSTSSAGESNTLAVTLSAPLPTPTPSPPPSAIPTSQSTSTPSPSPVPSPSPSLKPSPTLLPSPSMSMTGDPTVAGVAVEIDLSQFGISPTPVATLQGQALKPPQVNRSRLKNILYIGTGLTLLSIAGYFGYRKFLISKNNQES